MITFLVTASRGHNNIVLTFYESYVLSLANPEIQNLWEGPKIPSLKLEKYFIDILDELGQYEQHIATT